MCPSRTLTLISSNARQGLPYARYAASQFPTRSLLFTLSLARKNQSRQAITKIVGKSGKSLASITSTIVSANFGSRAIRKKIRRK